MERHPSRTPNLPTDRHESLLDRNRIRCGGSISAEERCIGAMNSGTSPGDGDAIKTSVRDSMNPGRFRCINLPWDQLQAIRRRLWILSATLESLHAKIERAYYHRGDEDGGAGPDQPRHSPDASGREWLAPQSEGIVASWWARRKLTRLRSRADRAERRAAAAIQDVSASCGAALEAVLQVAVARVKADEACLSSRRHPGPLRRDGGDD
jgi:hypothetical protein